MSARVVFLRHAKMQIQGIALDLADHLSQAARDFLDAVDATQQLAHPESGQLWEGDVRRMLLRRVPYSVFSFDDTRGVVTIIACYPNKSDPEKWRF